jgi:hypothetical protein
MMQLINLWVQVMIKDNATVPVVRKASNRARTANGCWVTHARPCTTTLAAAQSLKAAQLARSNAGDGSQQTMV